MNIQEQNEKTISVIIGNPPYNANQQNENDNNKNRKYPEIDKRIKDTYVAESTAIKTKQYDMYKRFIRWASDRLADDGILAFVSNSAFLGSHQDDGFRKVIADEFNELWVIDLKGNARTSGERRRREGGNIFEDKIRVGIAIYFLIRRKGAEGFKVLYNAIDDYEKAPEKSEYIRGRALASFEFNSITPDTKNYWLDQSYTDFDTLIAVANRQTKPAKNSNEKEAHSQAIFGLHSLGIASNRDDWTFDFSRGELSHKIKYFCNTYSIERKRLRSEKPDWDTIGDWFDRSIKWTAELEGHLVKGTKLDYAPKNIVPSLYRPFINKHCYFAPVITHRRYQQPQILPHGTKLTNKIICFSGISSSKPFSTFATDKLPSLDLLEKTQCLPLYRYIAGNKRVINITDWGLSQFRDHYGDQTISAEGIFAYTYAVLHDPEYREKYTVDLLREFPRLPFYTDFHAWAKIGQELLELHIGFESVEPFPLYRRDARTKPGKPRLKADMERGQIILDGQTTLEGVPKVAWEYRLGNRSALEWVLDQYKERKPRDPTIAERFNTYRFADHKDKVIDLLRRVCTVSVRTMELIDSMPSRSC